MGFVYGVAGGALPAHNLGAQAAYEKSYWSSMTYFSCRRGCHLNVCPPPNTSRTGCSCCSIRARPRAPAEARGRRVGLRPRAVRARALAKQVSARRRRVALATLDELRSHARRVQLPGSRSSSCDLQCIMMPWTPANYQHYHDQLQLTPGRYSHWSTSNACSRWTTDGFRSHALDASRARARAEDARVPYWRCTPRATRAAGNRHRLLANWKPEDFAARVTGSGRWQRKSKKYLLAADKATASRTAVRTPPRAGTPARFTGMRGPTGSPIGRDRGGVPRNRAGRSPPSSKSAARKI